MNPLLEKIQIVLRRPGLWNIGRLLSASVFAQVISVGISPIVTRIYTKEDYGFLAIIISVSSILGAFSTLQFHQTILLPKDEKDAKIGMALSFWVTILISIVCLIGILAVLPFLHDWFHFNEEYRYWFLLMPLMVLFSGMSNTISVWANRTQQYKLLSRSRIFSSLFTSGTTVGLGFVLPGPSGLILGFLGSSMILTTLLWFSGIRNSMKDIPFWKSSPIISWAKNNKDYPLMTLPSEFINIFINQLPIFLLTTLKGSGEAGLYNLCNRVLATPVSMVSSATGEFFRQKASTEFANKGDAVKVFRSTVFGLFGVGVIPFTVLPFFSPQLFAWLFGEEWRVAGEYAQVLSFMFLFKFVVNPISFMYYIAGRLKEDFVIHLYLITSMVLIFYFLRDFSTLIMITGFVINYILVYLFVGLRSWVFSKGEITHSTIP